LKGEADYFTFSSDQEFAFHEFRVPIPGFHEFQSFESSSAEFTISGCDSAEPIDLFHSPAPWSRLEAAAREENGLFVRFVTGSLCQESQLKGRYRPISISSLSKSLGLVAAET
jgi:hypothetical protein